MERSSKQIAEIDALVVPAAVVVLGPGLLAVVVFVVPGVLGVEVVVALVVLVVELETLVAAEGLKFCMLIAMLLFSKPGATA